LDAGIESPYSEQLIEYARLINERERLQQTYTDRSPSILSINERIDDLRGLLLASITQDWELVKTQIDSVDIIIGRFPEAEIRLAELTRAVELNTALVTQLETRLQEVRILENEQSGEVEIVDYPASAGTDQESGRGLKSIVGLLLGLMVGALLAFVLETMDTSIGTIEDVEEYLELPVLAVIPHLDVEKVAAQLVEENPQLEDDPNLDLVARLITQYDPKSPAAEAYRTLRTNLTFATAGTAESVEEKNTFVFTSSSLQEGKSTTIVNLAITIAQAGNRVLMMGCNMRRPTIFKSFGLSRETGMTDVLTGQKEWRECVKDVTDMMIGPLTLQSLMSMPGLDNLHIITAGGVPPNPSELLNSERFANVIEEASKEYDYVLVDAPPVLPVTDAAVVARKVDWAVLIYQVGKVPRNALRRAKGHLQNVGGHVLGIAMNDVKAEIGGYSPYSQYMTKYYGEETKDKRTLLQRARGWIAGLFGQPGDAEEMEPRPSVSGDDPTWIDVDYVNGEGKSVSEGERLKDLPYSRISSKESKEEAEEEGEAEAGLEPVDAETLPEETKDDLGEEFGDSWLKRIPVWAWILLLVVVATVILLISGVFSPGTPSDTVAQIEVATEAVRQPPPQEQPAAESRPVPTVSAPTRVWTIQVGSFRTEGEAVDLKNRIALTGDDRFSRTWARAEEAARLGIWHRVYVGEFAKRDDCQPLLGHIIDSGLTPFAMIRSVIPPAP
jgi:capsular exopolysaccharide synthesis family protein